MPASGSVLLPAFDRVFADIGDEQSLRSNLSTFSGHMTNIRNIMHHCTPASLVLLDELGTGTDPTEGAAMGAAILRGLAGLQPPRMGALLTLATTHFAHVSTLKRAHPPLFCNAAVDFDPITLAPTYQVLWGVSGKSHAFYIAHKLGLPQAILERAGWGEAMAGAGAGREGRGSAGGGEYTHAPGSKKTVS